MLTSPTRRWRSRVHHLSRQRLPSGSIAAWELRGVVPVMVELFCNDPLLSWLHLMTPPVTSPFPSSVTEPLPIDL